MLQSKAIERVKAFEPRPHALGATSFDLFGSTACGEGIETSDIDLFVKVDPAARFKEQDVVLSKGCLFPSPFWGERREQRFGLKSSGVSIFERVRAKHKVEDDLRPSINLGTRVGLKPAPRAQTEQEAVRIF